MDTWYATKNRSDVTFFCDWISLFLNYPQPLNLSSTHVYMFDTTVPRSLITVTADQENSSEIFKLFCFSVMEKQKMRLLFAWKISFWMSCVWHVCRLFHNHSQKRAGYVVNSSCQMRTSLYETEDVLIQKEFDIVCLSKDTNVHVRETVKNIPYSCVVCVRTFAYAKTPNHRFPATLPDWRRRAPTRPIARGWFCGRTNVNIRRKPRIVFPQHCLTGGDVHQHAIGRLVLWAYERSHA